MMLFPWIEPLFKFLRRRSPVYWAWLAIISTLGFLLGGALSMNGMYEARLLGGIWVLAFVIPLPFVFWSEKRWQAKLKAEDQND